MTLPLDPYMYMYLNYFNFNIGWNTKIELVYIRIRNMPWEFHFVIFVSSVN